MTHKDVQVFLKSRQQYGIKPGLERVNALLAAIDHPEQKLKAIHVTGTNGKGSTIAYLNDALMKQQYNLGVFSSPSMTDIYGHIKINDQSISSEDFGYCLETLMPHIKELDNVNNHPSEFEIITVIAFYYFNKKQVDIALIETGMGARLDTTNCLQPIISIITSISVDHTQFLGSTLEQITYEKAGILKRDTPTIIGHVSKESRNILLKEASKLNVPLYFLNDHFNYRKLTENEFTYTDKNNKINICLSMKGEHQIQNATIAFNALIKLKEIYPKISLKDALVAMEQTVVPGRFETILNEPRIIIDGAHNEASMNALLKTVETYCRNENIEILFAAFKDKQLTILADLIEKHFSDITLTTFQHERAEKAEDLAREFTRNDIEIEGNWQQYITNRVTENNDKTLIITGSIHFIFLVRQYIKQLH